MDQHSERKPLRRVRDRHIVRVQETYDLSSSQVECSVEDDELIEGVSVRGVLWRWQVRRRRQR